MAPNPSALVSGVSAEALSSSAPVWHILRRGISRSGGAAIGASAGAAAGASTGASTGYQVLRVSSKMNEKGDFNGTCSKETAMTITPETPDGSCSSYFADVTDYCCAAVGGMYDPTFRAVNVSETQAAALDHPICATSNYADMFSCYQYVTETHCSSSSPVPYGVCNKNGEDTSRAVRQTTSAAAPIANWRRTMVLGGLVACSAIQLLAN